MTDSPALLPYRWISGHPALDFTNTIAWSLHGGSHDCPLPEFERLTTYDRLVDWAMQAGLVGSEMAESLLEEARHSPHQADEVVDRAKDLREAIHQIFTAVFRHQQVPGDALALLNAANRDGSARRSIVETPNRFAMTYMGRDVTLDVPLWEAASSAVRLLTSESVTHVRECAGNPCGFLFLDTSRGHRRRWCDMADCGNRAKVRRHRRRERGEDAPTSE